MDFSVDYYACIKKLYPTITDNDFSLQLIDNSISFVHWNGLVFGDEPPLNDLEVAWLNVCKDIKKEEIKTAMYDEITNGTSGYQTQGLAQNFRINSSRSDLDNMRNLSSYLSRAIIQFGSGHKIYPGDSTSFADKPLGTISNVQVMGGSNEDGTAVGVVVIEKCNQLVSVGETILANSQGSFVCASIIKPNSMGSVVKDFYNGFRAVTISDLDQLVIELQGYGLWLYQHKWEKEYQISMCTSVEEVNSITWW